MGKTNRKEGFERFQRRSVGEGDGIVEARKFEI